MLAYVLARLRSLGEFGGELLEASVNPEIDSTLARHLNQS